MQDGQASRTALGAAGHRAAHQILEGGRVFADPFARRILTPHECAQADDAARDPARRGLRLLIAARSRFAEDRLAEAVARGLRQAVVLGAGLDTLSLRNPHAGQGLAVFEVDHPATQAMKQARIAEAGLSPAPGTHFAPMDFTRDDLLRRLAAGGVDLDAPVFFLWLGVVPYLTRAETAAVLTAIGRVGGEVAFDYMEPADAYAPERRAAHEALAAKVAAQGEAFRSAFAPQDMARILAEAGFHSVEDLDVAAISRRYFGRTAGAGGGGPHIVHARP